MSTTQGASTNANGVFAEARDGLLNSLTPTARALFTACPSVTQLIEDVRSDEKLSRNGKLLRRAISKIDALNASLSPYFKALDMFPQSNPEFAAIAWGAFKLALQLASNYTSFFEKLLRTLGRFAEEFPQYEHLVSRFKDQPIPPRLRQSLVNLYSDLLRFLSSIIGIFARKDGTSRRSHAIFADIIWKPYDLRFENFLGDLRFHNEIVKTELQFGMYHELREMRNDMQEKANGLHDRITHRTQEEEANLQKLIEQLIEMEKKVEAAQEAAESMLERANTLQTKLLQTRRNWKTEDEERYRIETVIRVREWLDPPAFAMDFETANELRMEGTSEWLFTEPNFAIWRRSFSAVEENSNISPWQNAFWVHGNLGCGKTVLAASIIEDFREVEPTENTCYFFFRANRLESDSCVQAYRSILAQTLQYHRSDWTLLNKFIFIMDNDSSGQKVATRKELHDLIQSCAQAGFIQTIVLDGIDECSDHAALIDDVSSMLTATSVKTLLFSRPTVNIPNEVPRAYQFSVGQATSGDIEMYLERQLTSLVSRGLLPPTADVSQLCSQLVIGANGMFIWARLMANYLDSSGLTVFQRLEEIKGVTLPEGLDKMYDRVFEFLGQGSGPDRELGKWLIMWISCTIQALTADELEEAVKVKNTARTETEDIYPDFERVVRSTCGGLVELSLARQPHTGVMIKRYRFIHLSVSEYLGRCLCKGPTWFLPSAADSHLSIARALLQYLIFVGQHVEDIRRPTTASETQRQLTIDHSSLTRNCPLWHYALTHWDRHLQQHRTELLKDSPDRYGEHESTLEHAPSLKDLLQAPSGTAAAEIRSESIKIFSEICSVLSSFVSEKGILTAYVEICYILLKKPNFLDVEEWFRWALHDQEKSGFGVTEALQHALDFIAFLKELDEAWGFQLREKPHLIWDEISAFMKSRFLEPTTTTKVHHLSPSGPMSHKISRKYLCKVSEVSDDQNHLGVLSIWPSRVYEELAMLPAQRSPTKQQIRYSATNWVAHYEIWTLTTNPEKTLEITIPLEVEDIWLQYQHSLAYATHSTGLTLQFPISISPCIRRFSILDRIYTLDIDEQRGKVVPTSFSLPFGSDDSLAHCWSPKQEAEDDEFWKRNGSFFYFIIFGPDGNSAFCVSRANRESRQYINLAVLAIDTSKNPPATLISPYAKFMPQSTGPLFCPPDTRHVLHPTLPLAIFTVSGFAYIWMYRTSTTDTTEPHILGVSSLQASHPDSTLWLLHSKFYLGDERYDSITFSEDGTHVILDGKTIIPLPHHIFAACNKSSSLNGGANLQTSISRTQPHTPSFMGSLLRTSSYRVSADGTTSAMSATTSGDSLRLELLQTSQQKHSTTAIELTTLPQSWKGASDVSASVSVPKTKEEIIRIVLNKASQPRYTMSEEGDLDRQLPVVIDRDALSVRKVESRVAWSKRKVICEDSAAFAKRRRYES
ncbi:hypothetical protein N0V90_005891 [Kalmusia sp. IMI 367209]|nr:hypothetical protein N0V90_005891 [Kalmusia sp. IMI 367209]